MLAAWPSTGRRHVERRRVARCVRACVGMPCAWWGRVLRPRGNQGGRAAVRLEPHVDDVPSPVFHAGHCIAEPRLRATRPRSATGWVDARVRAHAMHARRVNGRFGRVATKLDAARAP